MMPLKRFQLVAYDVSYGGRAGVTLADSSSAANSNFENRQSKRSSERFKEYDIKSSLLRDTPLSFYIDFRNDNFLPSSKTASGRAQRDSAVSGDVQH